MIPIGGNYKVIFHWYIFPVWITKISPDASLVCFRGQKGQMLLMYWIYGLLVEHRQYGD